MSEAFEPEPALRPHPYQPPHKSVHLGFQDIDIDRAQVESSVKYRHDLPPGELNGVITKEQILFEEKRRGPITGELLPPGTLLSGNGMILLQEPPTRRVVNISVYKASGCECIYEDCGCDACEDGDLCDDPEAVLVEECEFCRVGYAPDTTPYDLPFPWMLYMVNVRGSDAAVVWTGMSSKQVDDYEDKLVAPLLPNTWPDGGVCIGGAGAAAMREDPKTNLMGKTARAIEAYWSSDFNQDISSFASHPLAKEIFPRILRERADIERFYETLERLSVDDILSKIDNYNFEQIPTFWTSLRQILGRHLVEPDLVDQTASNFIYHMRRFIT